MLNHVFRFCRAVAAPLVALATLFLSLGIARAQDATTTVPKPEATDRTTLGPSEPKGYEVVFLVERDGNMEPMLGPAKKLMTSLIESLRKKEPEKTVRVGLVTYPLGRTNDSQTTMDLTESPRTITKAIEDIPLHFETANDGILIGKHLRRAVDKLSWSADPKIERRIYIVDNVVLRDGVPDPNWGVRVELVGQVPLPDGSDFRTAVRYAVSHGISVSVIFCHGSWMERHLRDLDREHRAWVASGKSYNIYDRREEWHNRGQIHLRVGPAVGEVYYWSQINWLEVAYLGKGEFYKVTQSGEPQRMSPEQVRYRAEVTMPREVLAMENAEWNDYLDKLLRLRKISPFALR